MMRITKKNSEIEAITGDLLVCFVSVDEVKAVGGQHSQGRRVSKRPSQSALSWLDAKFRDRIFARATEAPDDGKIHSYQFDVVSEDSIPPLLLIVWPSKESGAFELLSRYRKVGHLIEKHARKRSARSVSLLPGNISVKDQDAVAALLEGILLSAYRFDRYRSQGAKGKSSSEGGKAYQGIVELIVASSDIDLQGSTRMQTLCAATCFARDMVNIPPRDCTPTFLMKTAREVAKRRGFTFQAFDRARLKTMGAEALLAVAAGSEEPPYLIKMVYKPKGRSLGSVALVGKGVTFDSGGLSIKPGPSMEDMKFDMAGAAAVIAAMDAIGALKPKLEVRAYVPVTENMINGRATRPGDVVKAMNGKTVEILNTDAEGRLILADALSLAVKEKPELIIDLATLTGAAVVALGPYYAALYTEHDALAEGLVEAGRRSGERFWRMPLAKEYRELLKSRIADLKNIGGKWGGSITAALFLQEFVGGVPWVHLDIAGPAFEEGEREHIRKGGVGFGVRTLWYFLEALQQRVEGGNPLVA